VTDALTLAIVGDTHYTNPAYHRRTLAGLADNPNLEAGVRRHARTTEAVLPRLLDELRESGADLVIQLGDVVQGHGDDDEGDARELHEALDLLRQVGRPFLFARGTHEGRNGGPADAVYRRLYLGEIAHTLGEAPGRVDTSYAFASAGCRVVVLDYTTFAAGGAADRLLVDQLALAAARGERVLLCGHPPLVPVARPFFSRLEYAVAVLGRLRAAPAPVDAYFCGHTHNQAASVHRIAHHAGDDYWLPQLQSVPVGDPAQEPVPLDRVRPLLPPAADVRPLWGYLQGSLPGWFLVRVTAAGVRAQWRPLGRPRDGGEIAWTTAGRPEATKTPAVPPPAPVPEWPLRPGDARVERVWLRAAGTGSRAPHRVSLNGREIGVLGILESFNAQQGVPVPAECWPLLAQENELVIEPEASETRCLGGFVLEVTLAGGRVARTVPPQEWFATSDQWDGWRWSAPGLRRVGVRDPLRAELRF
jgi:hypothetical protein